MGRNTAMPLRHCLVIALGICLASGRSAWADVPHVSVSGPMMGMNVSLQALTPEQTVAAEMQGLIPATTAFAVDFRGSEDTAFGNTFLLRGDFKSNAAWNLGVYRFDGVLWDKEEISNQVFTGAGGQRYTFAGHFKRTGRFAIFAQETPPSVSFASIAWRITTKKYDYRRAAQEQEWYELLPSGLDKRISVISDRTELRFNSDESLEPRRWIEVYRPKSKLEHDTSTGKIMFVRSVDWGIGNWRPLRDSIFSIPIRIISGSWNEYTSGKPLRFVLEITDRESDIEVDFSKWLESYLAKLISAKWIVYSKQRPRCLNYYGNFVADRFSLVQSGGYYECEVGIWLKRAESK